MKTDGDTESTLTFPLAPLMFTFWFLVVFHVVLEGIH